MGFEGSGQLEIRYVNEAIGVDSIATKARIPLCYLDLPPFGFLFLSYGNVGVAAGRAVIKETRPPRPHIQWRFVH